MEKNQNVRLELTQPGGVMPLNRLAWRQIQQIVVYG
jgi:hypothetical protein